MAATHVATLGTHWVPTHTNTRKRRHTQTAPRRTRARYDENLGNGVGDPSTEEGRLVLGTRERQLTGNLPRRRHVQRHTTVYTHRGAPTTEIRVRHSQITQHTESTYDILNIKPVGMNIPVDPLRV